jgi:hypothetical protein
MDGACRRQDGRCVTCPTRARKTRPSCWRTRFDPARQPTPAGLGEARRRGAPNRRRAGNRRDRDAPCMDRSATPGRWSPPLSGDSSGTASFIGDRPRCAITARSWSAPAPPSFGQRSTSRLALPPAGSVRTRRRVIVAGCSSSVAHWVPQCPHSSSWRAIGAWQERHRRGMCRSRMAQRPFVVGADNASPAVGEPAHSGGYAPAMYLSPRRTLIALRATRTGALRRGDDGDPGERVAASVTSGLGGGSISATGDAGGVIAGSLCMLTLPERGSPPTGVPCSLGETG